MDTDNMLSVLEGYTLESADDVALKLAEDFRRRRIEKNLTREQVAEAADVSYKKMRNLFKSINCQPNSVHLKNFFAYKEKAVSKDSLYV
jgi:hypothetical protein